MAVIDRQLCSIVMPNLQGYYKMLYNVFGYCFKSIINFYVFLIIYWLKQIMAHYKYIYDALCATSAIGIVFLLNPDAAQQQHTL